MEAGRCFLCNSERKNERRPRSPQKSIRGTVETRPGPSSLSGELRIVTVGGKQIYNFTLQTILGLPEEVVKKRLEVCGYELPVSSLKLCEDCDSDVENVKSIYKELEEVRKKYEEAKFQLRKILDSTGTGKVNYSASSINSKVEKEIERDNQSVETSTRREKGRLPSPSLQQGSASSKQSCHDNDDKERETVIKEEVEQEEDVPSNQETDRDFELNDPLSEGSPEQLKNDDDNGACTDNDAWLPDEEDDGEGESEQSSEVCEDDANPTSTDDEECNQKPGTTASESKSKPKGNNRKKKSGPFKCDECPQVVYYNEQRYKQHRRRIHGLDLVKCNFCSEGFVNLASLNEHRRAAHYHEEFVEELKCESCDKICKGRKSLSLHVYCVHERKKTNYKCDICGHNYQAKKNLTIHLYRKHNIGDGGRAKELHHCPWKGCSKVYSGLNLKLFKSHLAKHEGKKGEYQCESCDANFFNKLSLEYHEIRMHQIVRPHRKNKLPTCENCGKIFDHNSHYRRHARGCGKDRSIPPEKCDLCEMGFASKADVEKHKLFKHPEAVNEEDGAKSKVESTNPTSPDEGKEKARDPAIPASKKFLCTECGKSYAIRQSLQRHIRFAHKRQFSHACSICGTVKWGNHSLEFHMYKAHGIEKEDSKLKCENCGKICSSVRDRKAHVFACTGTKPSPSDLKMVVCPTCGKEFQSKSNLTAHISQVHEKRKKKMCDLCGYQANSKGLMDRHNVSQHNIGDFRCDHEGCSKVFWKENMLQDHIKFEHMGVEKPRLFACDHCGKAFFKRIYLQNHLEAMHLNRESKPHKCRECGKGFATNAYLRMHLKLHLKDKDNTAQNQT